MTFGAKLKNIQNILFGPLPCEGEGQGGVNERENKNKYLY
jgi:hypothetical protein